VKPLRIGTRGSPLALWQARTVAALLDQHGRTSEIVVIKTSGDRLQEVPLSESGGKGLFVKEIEDALLSNDIDVAVHSAKDMSVALPDGLGVAAVLPRDDSRDALVLRGQVSGLDFQGAIAQLGASPSIGTGSVRRSAQLGKRAPGARFAPIRGNVDTRLRKLDAGEFDALILAVAGLRRLGHGARVSVAIPHDDCIPAPGQGIVAIETRLDDAESRSVLADINDTAAAACFEAERAVVATLGGGCQLPLGAIAVHLSGDLDMQAIVTSPDGAESVTRRARGEASRPAELGKRLADELAAAGAIAILEKVRYS
jgi:hydroxymethylbilane synthase